VAEQMTEDDWLEWYTALGFTPEAARAKAHALVTANGFPTELDDGTPADF
jgi:hypothetical protein